MGALGANAFMMGLDLEAIRQVRNVREHSAERALRMATEEHRVCRERVAHCQIALVKTQRYAARYQVRVSRASMRCVLALDRLVRVHQNIARWEMRVLECHEALRLAKEAEQRTEEAVQRAREVWRQCYGARLKMDEVATRYARKMRHQITQREDALAEEIAQRKGAHCAVSA